MASFHSAGGLAVGPTDTARPAEVTRTVDWAITEFGHLDWADNAGASERGRRAWWSRHRSPQRPQPGRRGDRVTLQWLADQGTGLREGASGGADVYARIRRWTSFGGWDRWVGGRGRGVLTSMSGVEGEKLRTTVPTKDGKRAVASER